MSGSQETLRAPSGESVCLQRSCKNTPNSGQIRYFFPTGAHRTLVFGIAVAAALADAANDSGGRAGEGAPEYHCAENAGLCMSSANGVYLVIVLLQRTKFCLHMRNYSGGALSRQPLIL